jgi:hypothetical protein
VADSAGANILVSALAALRDISSGSSMEALTHAAVAQKAAAEPADDLGNAATAAAEVQAAVAELFTSLSKRILQIDSNTSNADLLSRASSSNSSSGSSSSNLKPQTSLASALSSSSAVPDMTVQVGAGVALGGAAGSSPSAAAAAAVGFVPPAAVVLVSPAMDISEQACFYDEAWTAKHEAR